MNIRPRDTRDHLVGNGQLSPSFSNKLKFLCMTIYTISILDKASVHTDKFIFIKHSYSCWPGAVTYSTGTWKVQRVLVQEAPVSRGRVHLREVLEGLDLPVSWRAQLLLQLGSHLPRDPLQVKDVPARVPVLPSQVLSIHTYETSSSPKDTAKSIDNLS